MQQRIFPLVDQRESGHQHDEALPKPRFLSRDKRCSGKDGLAGTGNQVALRLGGTWKTDFPNAKVLVASLKTGDAFMIRSGGGGGYGDPRERTFEEIEEDVRQGYVSVKAAAQLYGVVIDPATFETDREATAQLRNGASQRATLP